MTRKALALAAGLVVLLSARDALAQDAGPPDAASEVDAGLDPTTHVKSSFVVTTAAGNTRAFAPSWIVPEPVWTLIDVELKRLQTTETVLGAENASLRASAAEGGFGWGSVVAVAAAVAGGILAGRMVF